MTHYERAEMFRRGFRDGAGGNAHRHEDGDYAAGYLAGHAASQAALQRFCHQHGLGWPFSVVRDEPTTTLFECRLCANAVSGWSDGHVQAPGWRTIEHIDGPNAICPRCAAGADMSDLLDEYPNAALGPAMPVRDATRV